MIGGVSYVGPSLKSAPKEGWRVGRREGAEDGGWGGGRVQRMEGGEGVVGRMEGGKMEGGEDGGCGGEDGGWRVW